MEAKPPPSPKDANQVAGSATSGSATSGSATSGDDADGGAARALLDHNGIDPGWLTTELNASGVVGTVTAIDAQLVGTGQVGENVRCVLRWDDPSGSTADANRPGSVVIKLASTNAASRAAAEATRTYIREVGFYRDVASTVAIRVPKTYHISEDRSANSFILVMEDISPARAGDQLTGCTLDQAGLAVDAAADLHGSTWGRPELAAMDWIDEPTEQTEADRVALFQMLYQGFVDRYRTILSPEELGFGEWLAANFEQWLAARPEPQCLIHGDFRPDNMLFGTDAGSDAGSGAPALTTVDWQTPSLGGGLSDVAYFLSGSLNRATLREHEAALLERYRLRLAGHGIELEADQVLREYRVAAPAGYVMAVIASQIVGQTERGDAMFVVMASGSASLARRLDVPARVG